MPLRLRSILTGSPWVNLMERCFGELTSKRIGRDALDSGAALHENYNRNRSAVSGRTHRAISGKHGAPSPRNTCWAKSLWGVLP